MTSHSCQSSEDDEADMPTAMMNSVCLQSHLYLRCFYPPPEKKTDTPHTFTVRMIMISFLTQRLSTFCLDLFLVQMFKLKLY